MIFERPWALVLLVALPFILARASVTRAPIGGRQLTATVLLQAAAALLLILAVAGPWQRVGTPPTTRVAIALPNANTEQIRAWRETTPWSDPFYVVSAGARPVVGERGQTEAPPAAGAPDLRAAMRRAASLAGGQPYHVALLGTPAHDGRDLGTFGRSTVHTRLGSPPDGTRLVAVRHPATIDVAAPFALELTVEGSAQGAIDITVRHGDQELAAQSLVAQSLEARSLDQQRGRRTASIAVAAPDAHGSVELVTELRQNGELIASEVTAAWIGGQPKILRLGSPANAEAARATLAPFGVDLASAAPGDALPLDDFDAVVIDDVPATAWPESIQQALRERVLSEGMGLWLTGSYSSLGPGGYSKSPLADILPVDMPQREERRDPSTTLVLIIDTSGSMGNRVELAKEVARLSIRRLLPHDKVGIVEFYGSKRWAAPVQPASNLIELTRALNRMQAGGGTIIYSALEEAYYAMLNVKTRFKHVLVLTDGGVESGPFEALARRMAGAGVNLSTVLIGPQANSTFLMNLAQWGRGRFYACPSRFQLPDLRLKEPQTSLLPAVENQPFSLDVPRTAEATAAFDTDEPALLRGLVEARAKPEAEILMTTRDGNRPALVAWDQGLGRVAVWASELLGPMTDELRGQRWSQTIADTLRSLAAGRRANAPRLDVRPTRDVLEIEVHDRRLATPPTVVLSSEDGGEHRVTLTPNGDHFTGTVAWPDDDATFIASVDGHGELRAAARRPTDRPDRVRDVSTELNEMAIATAGSTKGDLPQAGIDPERDEWKSIAPLLALGGLLLWLLGVLVRRWPAAGGVAAAALALAVAPPATAQSPRDQIREEILRVGHVDQLREAWADGTTEQRLALALEDGDLAAAAELLDAAGDRDDLLSLLQEARGDLAGALRSAQKVRSGVEGAEALAWDLRIAKLALAQGEGPARLAAVAKQLDPRSRWQLGHLAAGLGAIDLALELHVVPDDATAKERLGTALRRALWAERDGRFEVAQAAYAEAYAVAGTRRDRRYVLARTFELLRSNGKLGEAANDWSDRIAELDLEHRRMLLRALRETDRGRDALALLNRPEFAELQQDAFEIAVAAGAIEEAIRIARGQLAEDPQRIRLRVALALLLSDRRQPEAARDVLIDGLVTERRQDVLALVDAAIELADGEAVNAGATRLRELGDGSAVDAVLSEARWLESRGKSLDAVRTLLDARATFEAPNHRVRIAEALEGAGRTDEATAIYSEVYEETRTEDLALRLAWLLSTKKSEADRKRSQDLFRTIWLEAGSPGRRVQAEERVLDLASRDGTLADLAIELEEAVAKPETPKRHLQRMALVKIWSRAQDSFGAREVLMQWAAEEPDREIDAWRLLAQIHLENEEFRAHEKAMRKLIELDPEGELEYRQQLSLSFLERGRTGDARVVIREMLDGSSDAIAYEFGAGIYSLAGRPADAARLYRQTLEIHPDRVETLLSWANAMAADERADAAIGRFLLLLMQDDIPDDLFLVAVDGLLNLEAPRPNLRFAERALRARLAARPNRVFLHRALQDVLESLGDKKSRVTDLEETVLVAGLQRTAWLRELMEEAGQRRDWDTYLFHAGCLLESGDEVPPTVFVEIGEALLTAGDLRAAESAFERARLAPDFAAIERRVAGLFETNGLLDDAERVWRRVLRRDSADPRALIAVARVTELKGEPTAALALYGDAAARLIDSIKPKPSGGRSFNRNQKTTGPTWDNAADGVIRCSQKAADTESLAAALIDRLERPGDADVTQRNAWLTRLRRVAAAWELESAKQQVVRFEGAILEDSKGNSQVATEIASARKARGDLDGALAAIENLADRRTVEMRLRLQALRGDALADQVADVAPEYLRSLGQLAAMTDDPATAEAARLRITDLAAEDPTRWDRDLRDLHRITGVALDEAALADRQLANAIANSDPEKSWASRIVAAIKGHPSPTEAQRDEAARAAVRAALKADTGQQAFYVLQNLTEPKDALADLVELAFKDMPRAYTIPQRVPFLVLLEEAEALRVFEECLRRQDKGELNNIALRMLAEKTTPAFLHPRLVDLVQLDDQPITRSYLTRLAYDSALPPATAALLRERWRSKLGDDEVMAMLTVYAEPDPEKQQELLIRAADRLTKNGKVDYQTERAAMALKRMATPATLAALRVRDLEGPAASIVRGTISPGTREDDPFVTQFESDPGNSWLLNKVVTRLTERGQKEKAVECYRSYFDASGKVYAHYANRCAKLMTDIGRPQEALEILDGADDPSGMTLPARLRAAVGIEDAEKRGPALRRWAQLRQGSQRSLGRVMFVALGQQSGRHGLREVLELPRTVNEDELTPLGQAPEGLEIARSLMRGLTQPEEKAPLIRAMMAAAAQSGVLEQQVRMAVDRLATHPHDPNALTAVAAATTAGAAVDDALVDRAIRYAALDSLSRPERVADAIELARDRPETLKRLVTAAPLSRGQMSSHQMRERIWMTLEAIASVAPGQLTRLGPPSRTQLNSWFDGDLVAVRCLRGDRATMLNGFDDADAYLTERSPNHWSLRLGLPLFGARVASGQAERAWPLLQLNDPQLDSGDHFPAITLAATVPPLDRWNDPGQAIAVGQELNRRLAAEAGNAKRSLLFRMSALLGHRLLAAERIEDATRHFAELDKFGAQFPQHADWLKR